MAGGARGPDLDTRVVPAQVLPALGQGLGMGEDDLDLSLAPPNQAMPDGQIDLSHYHHIQAQEKIHDHRDRSFQAVLDRNDAFFHIACFHGAENLFEVTEVDEPRLRHGLRPTKRRLLRVRLSRP